MVQIQIVLTKVEQELCYSYRLFKSEGSAYTIQNYN